MAGAAPNHGRSARRFALLLPTFDIACGWLLEESNTRGTRDSRGRWPNSNLALAGTAPLACPADSPLAGALVYRYDERWLCCGARTDVSQPGRTDDLEASRLAESQWRRRDVRATETVANCPSHLARMPRPASVVAGVAAD
ncbi:hypothetical protein VFPFJ_03077 [Purpureocillium lilacinum]|uniref:Uncharacterized protein n=1 Tax=Purpureocillium lilacinum TaxID=33203 RepID=A0A179FWB5_PURLI|nr:hypothetical protein VFPFJ_03077 [Purpureocillium lilacinum]OAQ69490.1 hypothetical protein VFPBJ_10865 [Purpureocillium lilacinum]OAQ91337.1 hypothetical protein VFPFJ_03077 [Purpureocillium lilacinum]